MRHLTRKAKVFALAGALMAGIFSPVFAKQDKADEAAATQQSETPTAAFTDSTRAELGGAKRVVISDVVVHLQTSTGFTKSNNLFLGKARVNAGNADAILTLGEVSHSTMTSIADSLYKQLAEDLKAAGYEVVPESQLKSSVAYQELLKKFSKPQFIQQANIMGDEVAFGPASLGFYLPGYYEVGTFETEKHPLIGTSGQSFGEAWKQRDDWKIAGGEQQIAKELNAVVVKASYFLTFGSVTGIDLSASSKKGGTTTDGLSGTKTTEYSITTTASGLKGALVLGLIPDQTRIAFRTANGKRFQMRSMLKLGPAKDGDVVVRLANDVVQNGIYFNLGEGRLEQNRAKQDNAQRSNAGLFGGLKKRFKLEALGKGDVTATAYVPVTLVDSQKYVDGVSALVKKTNAAMLALVKQ